jgi:hypothetical protein
MDNFNKLLDQYKTQYLKFLNSGDESAKTAYQKAYEAIESTLSEKQKDVESEKQNLAYFAKSYQKSNQELQDVSSGATDLIRNAQDIHDDYKTAKNRYDDWTANPPPLEATIDVSVGYAILLRIGILLILLPVLLYAGYMVPDLAGSSLTQKLLGKSVGTPGSPYLQGFPATPRAWGW